MSTIETRHEFGTSEAAWRFMRDCDANGSAPGYPALDNTNAVRVLRQASVGHVAVLDGGSREAFEQCGEIFISPADRPLDIHGRRQGARWECSRAHWDRYYDTLYAARVESTSRPTDTSASKPDAR